MIISRILNILLHFTHVASGVKSQSYYLLYIFKIKIIFFFYHILFTCLLFINMNFNTFSKFTNFITHICTYVTAVANRTIKVTLNGTTHNSTLVNSLPDQ